MKGKRSQQTIERRCKILQQMGFTVGEDDSMVSHPAVNSIGFDLSATDEKHFLEVILRDVYHAGHIDGQNATRKQLADLTRLIEP